MADAVTGLKTVVIIWTILPWLFLTCGISYCKSILWSFFLYHVCCLLPIIIWRRKSWTEHLIPPTVKDFWTIGLVGLGLGIFIFVLHALIGTYVVERQHALAEMALRGFQKSWLIPLSLYFVIVNPAVEELFWRGVVLNDLCDGNFRMKSLPYIWTNVSFAAWHFLVIRLFVSPPFWGLAITVVASVGFFLSWLYKRTGSVILPMLWHGLVFDMAVIVLLWLIV